MNEILTRLAAVRDRIHTAAQAHHRDPDSIRLLAVSKTKPVEDIRIALDGGQRAFGENYLQDALPKIAALAGSGIEWHYIGRLQSNKARDIAGHFSWVHGLDQLHHAERLSRCRPADLGELQLCIQVNLSEEASKGGVSPEAVADLAAAVSGLPGLRLRGLMTMPDPGSPPSTQRAAFRGLRKLKEQLNADGIPVDTLSMGMSGDLEAAIAEGATIVRIGTDIFGARR